MEDPVSFHQILGQNGALCLQLKGSEKHPLCPREGGSYQNVYLTSTVLHIMKTNENKSTLNKTKSYKRGRGLKDGQCGCNRTQDAKVGAGILEAGGRAGEGGTLSVMVILHSESLELTKRVTRQEGASTGKKNNASIRVVPAKRGRHISFSNL